MAQRQMACHGVPGGCRDNDQSTYRLKPCLNTGLCLSLLTSSLLNSGAFRKLVDNWFIFSSMTVLGTEKTRA